MSKATRTAKTVFEDTVDYLIIAEMEQGIPPEERVEADLKKIADVIPKNVSVDLLCAVISAGFSAARA